MARFPQNIDQRGRLIRGAGAAILAILAAVLWPHSRLASGALVGAAAFVAFEATRGWCALRACGLKTRF